MRHDARTRLSLLAACSIAASLTACAARPSADPHPTSYPSRLTITQEAPPLGTADARDWLAPPASPDAPQRWTFDESTNEADAPVARIVLTRSAITLDDAASLFGVVTPDAGDTIRSLYVERCERCPITDSASRARDAATNAPDNPTQLIREDLIIEVSPSIPGNQPAVSEFALAASRDHAEGVLVVFEPPMTLLAASMSANVPLTWRGRMTVRSLKDPRIIKTSGDATRTIHWDRRAHATLGLHTLRAVRVVSTLEASLGLARVTEHNIEWWAAPPIPPAPPYAAAPTPDPATQTPRGLLFWQSTKRTTALGLSIRNHVEVWTRTPD